MAYLDPVLLHSFRRRIANPKYWRRTASILCACRREQLLTHEGAGALVGQLSGALGVPLTASQYANACNWLVSQRIDPRNPAHQARLWGVVRGM